MVNISYYRIYRYPYKATEFKHIYFYGRRSNGKHDRVGELQQASQNADNILEVLRLEQSLSRTRRTIHDYMLCNKWEMFCTFTFNGDRVDRYNLKECCKKIINVFDNYKQRYSPCFKYLIIPELHKDGAVHFHGVVSGIRPADITIPDYIWSSRKNKMIPNRKKYVDWEYYSSKLGFFNCSVIKKYGAFANYITKYITKDMLDMEKGCHMYYCSKNLVKPELIYDEDDIPRLVQPKWQGDYCEVTYLTEQDSVTLGVLPPYWADRPQDYLEYDNELTELNNDGLGGRITEKIYEQLKLGVSV